MSENNAPERARKNWFLRYGWIVLLDIIVAAALLAGFAYLHHAGVSTETGARLVSCRNGVIYKLENGFDVAYNESDTGIFEFADRFYVSEPLIVENGDTTYYKDDACEIAMTEYTLATGKVQVADVYISDISLLRAGMANDAYGKGQKEDPLAMTQRLGSVFSVTGDNYSERGGGVVMRNGVLYSQEIDRDVCVLNWDGTMDLIQMHDFNLPEIMENGAYQIWSFGPILADNGKAADEFITDQLSPMRRAAMGYYEPGHYCFVIMDGEVTLEQLADTMVTLGCESAYALYGGRLAEMNFDGKTISTAQEIERKCSDIIMIGK